MHLMLDVIAAALILTGLFCAIVPGLPGIPLIFAEAGLVPDHGRAVRRRLVVEP
jgi:hypothetical protein